MMIKRWLVAVAVFAIVVGVTASQGSGQQTAAVPGGNCTITQDRSISSVSPLVNLKFVNDTDVTVDIYWLNFLGQREFFQTLGPGQSYVQGTYLTHPWVAVAANSGVCVGYTLAFAGEYHVTTLSATDLGTLPGGNTSFAYAISNGGQVVGESETSSGEVHAFSWTEAGGMVDIGGDGSTALGVNDSGVIVGQVSVGGELRPFTSNASYTLADLGGQESVAAGINDAGIGVQIVGWSKTSGGAQHAVIWSPGPSFVTIPRDLGTLPGGASSFAASVNDFGTVVGGSATASNSSHAFVWTDAGGMVDLGALPGGTYSAAFAVNNDGLVVGESSTSGASAPFHAFAWTRAGGMVDLGTLGGDSSGAFAVNGVGRVVGYSEPTPGQAFNNHAFSWTPGGMADVGAITGCASCDANAAGVNDSGQIVGGSGPSGGQTHATLWAPVHLLDVDSDGDGLLDSWETNGIDADANGTVDLVLNLPPYGADPLHKDVFVEVDYMAAYAPQPGALSDVTAAFAAAPVSNPDGTTGVRLHALLDEVVPTIKPVIFLGRGAGALDDFDDLKLGGAAACDGFFGMAAERSGGNCAAVLRAKRLAFHYAVFGHSYTEVPTSSGIAELPGNDFIVTLGGKAAAWIAAAGGMRPAEAGTFMHELGHNLDLRHGGFDNSNCKPNYQSVMTYTLQVPYIDPMRPLDYSRQLLPTLNESALDESFGVGGASGYVVFGVGGVARVASAAGPIDWNNNGSLTSPVTADVNSILTRPDGQPLTGCGPSPSETLVGHDDWAALRYDFRTAADFADGAHETAAPLVSQELTSEIALETAQNVDADGDGVPNASESVPAVLQFLLDRSRDAGAGTSLENKAREVQKTYNSGKTGAACSLLNGYIQEVKAQAGKKISKPTAEELIETAALIRTLLRC